MVALGSFALAGISFLIAFILGCAGAPYSSVDSVAQTFLPLSGRTPYSPLHARFAAVASNAEPTPGIPSTSVPSSSDVITVTKTTPPPSTTASTIAQSRPTVEITSHIGPSIHPTHTFSHRTSFHRSTAPLQLPTNSVSNVHTNNIPAGVIVGCVLGGVAVMALALVSFLFCIRRARRRPLMWVQDTGGGITPFHAPEMRQSVRESYRRNGIGRNGIGMTHRSMGPNGETRSLAPTRETYYETRSESDSLWEKTLFEEGEDIAAHVPTRSNPKLVVVS